MAKREMLRVFCYDIASSRRRTKVAAVLEEDMVRVQKSVFEARLSHEEARELARRARALMEPGDRLRIYAVGEDGLRHSLAVGGAPLAEAQDFWIL